MNKGVVVYVDENQADIEEFQLFADDFFDLHIIKIENEEDIEETFEKIMSHRPHAVVTDYLLNEHARVDFDGQSIIDLLRSKNKYLPCFLLTSHAPDALTATNDAQLVQSKSVPFGNDQGELKSLFKDQISRSIEIYKNLYRTTEFELRELSSIDENSLDARQIERLIELDDLLDSLGAASDPIPREAKNPRSIALLSELVLKVDDLLAKHKK